MEKITEHNPLYRGHFVAGQRHVVKKHIGDTNTLGESLPHHTLHSPDGFAWGYGGSGPAELARCLLIDALDVEKPHPALYQSFKDAFVARWPQECDWQMDAATIRRWVIGWCTGGTMITDGFRGREAAALGVAEPTF